MADLKTAKEIASFVRFSEDKPVKSDFLRQFDAENNYRDSMLRHDLLISMNVTPELEKRVVEVCERLQVPRASVNAFVYNSAEVQASCVTDSSATCILKFSSGLVNLMDEKEFQFIVGHELAHFLLDHGVDSQNSTDTTIEGFLIKRARELSADRLGYLSLGDIDQSVRAIMKIASGLGEKFLRFDVSAFMNQKEMILNPKRRGI